MQLQKFSISSQCRKKKNGEKNYFKINIENVYRNFDKNTLVYSAE